MTKKKKTALIIIGILLLGALCCVFVTMYANYIINKPKYEVPDPVPAKSITEISESDEINLKYVQDRFCYGFVNDCEVSFNTGLSTSIVSEKSDPDTKVVSYVIEKMSSGLSSFRESVDKACGGKITPHNGPNLSIDQIESIEITQGTVNDKGELKDDNFYFFNVIVNPDSDLSGQNNVTPLECTFDLADVCYVSDALKNAVKDMCDITVNSEKVTECIYEGKINRIFDQIASAKFTKKVLYNVTLDFKGVYSKFGSVDVEFQITMTDSYNFNWFGAYFTKDAVYMNPGDYNTLPMSVTVSDSAAQDEFEVLFVSSDENIVTVDEDGIATAVVSSDTPATITMTLKYKGVTYTDTISVVVTDLEVEE